MESGAPQRALEIPKRWPLVSKLQTRTTAQPFNKDARLINGYVEYDPEDNEYWIYKRFGLGNTPQFGPGGSPIGRGIYTFLQPTAWDPTNPIQVVAVFNNDVHSYHVQTGQVVIYPNQLTFGGNYSPPASFETYLNSGIRQVFITTDAGGWVFSGSGWSTVSDTNFAAIVTTGICPGIVYLDGTFYVMDKNGAIWNSAINQPLNWTPATSILASNNADGGVALAKQLSYVIAFKQWTTQVFYDAGNATGSPLGPVPDAQLPYGCFAASSVQSIDNTLLWMTSNQTMSPQVVRMDNLQPQVVSTPAVERILDDVTFNASYPGGGIWSTVLKHAGHRLYMLAVQQYGFTLVYDLDQPAPANWYFWTDALGTSCWPIVGTAYIPPGQGAIAGTPGIHLAQHVLDGYVFKLDDAAVYPSDAGTLFPVDIYTPNFDGGTDRRKVMKALYPNADQTKGSYLQVRFNDSDYDPAGWSNWRTLDLGLKKPKLRDNGTFRKRRAYHLRHQCNTPFRIKTLDMQLLYGSR